MSSVSHEGGYGLYWRTWLWLLVITALEIGVTLIHLPRALLVSLLVVMAILKVVLIAAHFMHLRFEHLNLVYMVVTPIVLIIALVFGIAPDTLRPLA